KRCQRLDLSARAPSPKAGAAPHPLELTPLAHARMWVGLRPASTGFTSRAFASPTIGPLTTVGLARRGYAANHDSIGRTGRGPRSFGSPEKSPCRGDRTRP